MITARRVLLAASAGAFVSSMLITHSAAATEAQDKVTATITASAYAMSAMKDGKDISDRWLVKAIRYAKDGTATSTLNAGVEVKSSWSLDDAAKIITINSPGQGVTRWEILEATPAVFRKRNLASGVEAIQTPKP
jgi:hypothetical protein